jgi:protein-arginine deiminase
MRKLAAVAAGTALHAPQPRSIMQRAMHHPPLAALLLLAPFIFPAACGSSDGPAAQTPPTQEDAGAEAGTPVADLRADNNRDGVVDVQGEADDQAEDTWDATHGAVFLANIDDDQKACPTSGTDAELAACNDAADEVVNGPDDLLDLARLKTKPWPGAPDGATGVIQLTPAAVPFVRLFKKQADDTFKVLAAGESLTAEELRTGVELAIEGRDVVRDATVWDGYVDVTLEVTSAAGGAKDTVRMRLSPVLTQHHLMPMQKAFVTLLDESDSQVFRTDFAAAVQAAAVPEGVDELTDIPDLDQWTQDFFEAGYMSMPEAGGQHVVRVFLRSSNVYDPSSASDPLRLAGKVVFTHFRGKDVAGLQAFNAKHSEDMDSLDSFGNTETVPPHGDYPLGRILRGSVPSFHPDPVMATLLASQNVQPPLLLDTSWLYVGHVDEVFSFAKASSPRGWVLLANDPALAKKMLEDQVTKGNGAIKMFVGKKWVDENWNESSAEITIQDVLNDTDVMTQSASAAASIDSMIQVLKKETGVTDEEIIHVPFLHFSSYDWSIAYQPGTVNGTYLSDTHFAAPDPHGPVIDGKDIFKTQLEEAFKPLGITVDWVEDWDLYHRLEGEVHCGSNAMRTVTGPNWWESGR